MSARTLPKKSNLFQMNHALGQNILKSKNVVKQIVDFGELKQDDTVLEIGPGNGNMTEEIISRGCKVLAVEKDPRMVVALRRRFTKPDNPVIRQADVLEVELPDFDVCISNIPYNISSAIIFKLLQKPTFRRAVLMVQKEFADRIVARPGSDGWGRLALNAQLRANVRQVMSVSRKNFVPAPKVDSAVISIQPRETQADIDFEEWDGLVKLCFNRPNRTLQGTFSKKKILKLLDQNRNDFLEAHGASAEETIDVFVRNILDETMLGQARPSSLDIEDFLLLLQKFNEGGLHFK